MSQILFKPFLGVKQEMLLHIPESKGLMDVKEWVLCICILEIIRDMRRASLPCVESDPSRLQMVVMWLDIKWKAVRVGNHLWCHNAVQEADHAISPIACRLSKSAAVSSPTGTVVTFLISAWTWSVIWVLIVDSSVFNYAAVAIMGVYSDGSVVMLNVNIIAVVL